MAIGQHIEHFILFPLIPIEVLVFHNLFWITKHAISKCSKNNVACNEVVVIKIFATSFWMTEILPIRFPNKSDCLKYKHVSSCRDYIFKYMVCSINLLWKISEKNYQCIPLVNVDVEFKCLKKILKHFFQLHGKIS